MGKMPHIQLDETIGATCAILPGDPARVDEIAKYLTDVRPGAFNREYKSLTGYYKGRRVLAISTGMGGPSAAICIEELADLGVNQMVRIGSCGALQKELRLGQLVICDRAVCDDGTSQTYLDMLRYASGQLSFGRELKEDEILFADADPDMVRICENAARELDFDYAVGSTRSHDGLYLARKGELDSFYSGKGIYASDMETAALFAVGAKRDVRCVSILNVVVEWKKDIKEGVGAYKDGADAAARGERDEIILALETLVNFVS